MKKAVMTVLAALPAVALAELFGDIPNAKHAWAVHDWNRLKPSKVEVSANGIPSDAIVLFDGTEESMRKNWCTLTYDGEKEIESLNDALNMLVRGGIIAESELVR